MAQSMLSSISSNNLPSTPPVPKVDISIADPSVYAKIGEISAQAFKDDPYRIAAYPGMSDEEYAHFVTEKVRHQALPEGMKDTIIIATRKEDGEVIGWARWLSPMKEGQDRDPIQDAGVAGETPKKFELPAGTDKEGLKSHKEWNSSVCTQLLGDRPHYVLAPMAVTPLAQRSGAGSALMKWGCDRADEDGLPAFVSGSLMGARLYERFGFVSKEQSTIVYPMTGREVWQTNMVREPKS